MTKQEIEQAAREWADNFDSHYPTCAKIKQQTSHLSFQKGAEMVNFRQPYTAEDMRLFYVWCIINGWHPYDDDGDFDEWLNVKTNKLELFDIVLKLWEESKNG